jgi:hypothetical protein
MYLASTLDSILTNGFYMAIVFRITLLILSMTLLSGCASLMTINKAWMKYNSLTHIDFDQSTVSLSMGTEELAFTLSEKFRELGGSVLERKAVNTVPRKTENSRLCWEAKNDLSTDEFKIYQTRDYSMFKGLEPATPFNERNISPDCKIYEFEIVKENEVYFLTVDFPDRNSSATIYQPTLNTFFMSNGTNTVNGLVTGGSTRNVGAKANSKLRIWIWPKNNNSSNIFMEANPVSNGVESTSGPDDFPVIGVLWWKIINGEAESNLIRSYVLLFEEYERKLKQAELNE